MSELKTLIKSNAKVYTYNFDFTKHQKESSGILVEKNVLNKSPFFLEDTKHVTDTNAYPWQYYLVDGEVYAFTGLSRIAKYYDNKMNTLSLNFYNSTPQVLSIEDGGTKKVLVIEGAGGEILGERQVSFFQPMGSFVTYTKKRLFYASDSMIFFTDEFDNLSEIESKQVTNCIPLDKDLGSVQGMYEIGNELIVVCYRGICILTLSHYKDGYSLKRVNTIGLKVTANSVAPYGTGVCFLSDLNFCIFDGSKVSFYPILKNELSVKASGEHDGFYVVNYKEKIYNKTMVIDIASMQVFHTINHEGISKKGGYATSPQKRISVISRVLNSNYTCTYQSEKFDFSTPKEKRIVEIECYATSRTELTLQGDFGSLNLLFDGYSLYKCNQKSRYFSISCSMLQGALPFRDLKIKYKILGE